jgi:endonuclease/exonuclease/phosphatase family metal-dependent hydrolase
MPVKRKELVAFAVAGAVLLVFALQAYTAQNYTEENYPFYSGNYAPEELEPIETLTVVSYNIWFGDNLDQAISELQEVESQEGLDILLLQEMDEVGTDQIARELQLNYVYYPAAIEPTYDENFGNAILSRWPITDPQKLILPHKSLSNRMNRTATKATIRIDEIEFLVYSTHTESIFTLPRFRQEQYTAILQDIDPEAEFVIVGGDFNSFTPTSVDEIEVSYQDAGLVRVSKDSGHSVVKFGIGLSTDHIFAKGFTAEEAGKLAGAKASDHLPIWVTMTR